MEQQHKGRGETEVYYRKVCTLYVMWHHIPKGRLCYGNGVHFKPSSHHKNKSRKLELISHNKRNNGILKRGSINTTNSSKEGRKGRTENRWGKSNTSSAMTDLKLTRPIVTLNVNG